MMMVKREGEVGDPAGVVNVFDEAVAVVLTMKMLEEAREVFEDKNAGTVLLYFMDHGAYEFTKFEMPMPNPGDNVVSFPGGTWS
jgi:hypothetical protein